LEKFQLRRKNFSFLFLLCKGNKENHFLSFSLHKEKEKNLFFSFSLHKRNGQENIFFFLTWKKMDGIRMFFLLVSMRVTTHTPSSRHQSIISLAHQTKWEKNMVQTESRMGKVRFHEKRLVKKTTLWPFVI